ncbi:hypothetical protein [Aeromicrobium sp. UC242_57]|uniref:hypothetical protein n=1 Tax=Aeromicrobium sp. UC242_57 TaxID=3374624 RepID=UPI00378895DB
MPSLSGRYFWGNDARDRAKGWNPRAVLFVNKKWAYVGIPPRGVPSCRKTTKQCKRYTYRGGRLKIAGSARVKVTSEGFTRGRIRYAPLSLPGKNTTMSLTLHHQDFRGCGVYPYCTTWTETLSMSKNRRFVLTRTSISSIGYPGTGTISHASDPMSAVVTPFRPEDGSGCCSTTADRSPRPSASSTTSATSPMPAVPES